MSAGAQIAFVDLSAFSELESYLYAGKQAATYFVGSVQKGNWFSLIPSSLRETSSADFDTKTSAIVHRSADYLLQCWFSFSLPIIQLADDNTIFDNASVRWTRMIGHNIFAKVSLTHNELISHEFTSQWLDFNYQYNVVSSKRIGYRNMIGDVASNYNAVRRGVHLGVGSEINVPLPLWFAAYPGRALPIAAIPFVDTKINYEIRHWNKLIVVYPGDAGGGGSRIATINDVHVVGSPGQKPKLIKPETFALYAVVHNDERMKMGKNMRDILINQTQQAPTSPFKEPNGMSAQNFIIRFSNSITSLFFAAQNTSIETQKTSSGAEFSNYTTQPNYDGDDPYERVQLMYDNNNRVDMSTAYFSMVSPFFHAQCIPDETGYHLWSYALDISSTNPCGSTNFTKLSAVTIAYTFSESAINSSNPTNPTNNFGNQITWSDMVGTSILMPQTFRHILIANNHNIGRVANGSFGFPTL